ncbi:variant erythrocyte surface antigen-1 family protein [Babesia caballi]|uniref:Variant erythrocyte surface antigen-1 family protein n=1 Tax=Babesia caballi TaxID=5871 RepID=A0AAV4LVH1_BABCB|nr:variant erythrocyte surface antigen-1 family protein [Babesia caballi]
MAVHRVPQKRMVQVPSSPHTGDVKQLLGSVEGCGIGFGAEFQKVKDALSNGSIADSLITKLADGLWHFIGYKQNGNGIIEANKGVAVSSLPVERLRDAVLMFIGPFLGVLRYTHPDLKTQAKYTTPIGNAVEACKNGVGRGQGGFQKALGTVETALAEVSSGLSGDIKVLDEVKKVSAIKTKDDVGQLANGFKTYLKAVLDKVEAGLQTVSQTQAKQKVTALKTKLETLVDNVGKQKDTYPINVGQGSVGSQQGLKNDIDGIYKAGSGALTTLRNAFPNFKEHKAAYALSAAAYNGVNLFVTVLQTDYISYYKDATWENDSDKTQKCAKIFLACLPLIFNGLSYFYWKCSNRGGWKDMTLGSPDPKAFMGLTSIGANRVKSGLTGSDVVSKAFQNFSEFKTAANGSSTSYADFLKKFRETGQQTWKGSSSAATDDTFLSGLYLCSTSYFRHQHQKKAAQARPPSSIREMLYWLMGLTATPQFGDLLGHIDNVIGPDFKVGVSGSTKQNETLSADQVTSYILSTCYTAPSVLDIIQGSLEFNASKGEPWLHDLYSNSAFPFRYPFSGAALFYALSDYTYALQFQLSFLHKQCQDMYTNTCGWQFCTFGKDINKSLTDTIVESHICSVGCTTGDKHSRGDHGQGYCQHTDCGKNSSASPLQAFLTDKLKGFSRGHPSDPSSHLATCSGSLCHVPMGFANNLRPGSVQGGNISLALKPFCGSHNTPLRQLCGTLTCLSKRAPRSLGDLFGFYWQVTGQLFNKAKDVDHDPSNNLSSAIKTLLSKLTTVKSGLLYKSITANVESIGRQFFGLSWHCHRKQDWKTVKRTGGGYCNDHKGSNKACDLMSLYDSECTGNNATCGKYLEALGISYGATFADKYASTYLTWALYLTDDIYESLQEFLDTFNGHSCKGCKSSSTSSSHTSASQCQCPSVVDCGDVLPHLYSNGFNFKDAFSLKGMQYTNQKVNYTQTAASKRQCSAFANQLQAVISGNPLSSLLTSIDYFLFLFRFYFFYNQSAFWTIYVCLILYTFFFLLDTLRVRSHLKITASHTFPPLSLLTSGNPLPVTKLTYITQ